MRRILTVWAALAGIFVVAPAAWAQEDGQGFVEANILSILYHELGHALINIEGLPIFGQEEDAADVLSIFLIDALFEEETAQDLARDAAIGFWFEAAEREEEVSWWDVHGPDEQRYFNTVCLFYGADPDGRQAIAEELGLPEDRADYCPEEYDQAATSWGQVLDDLADGAPGHTIVYAGETGANASLAEQILADEVAALNQDFALSDTLRVTVESCGEANAFYDPSDRTVVFCAEFEDYLFELAEQQ